MNAGLVVADGGPLIASAYGVLAWSPDGTKILVVGRPQPEPALSPYPQGPVVTTLIDVRSGSADWHRDDAASTSVAAAAFGPDGTTMAVVTVQGVTGSRLDVLTMPNGVPLVSLPLDSPATVLVVSPDGRLVALAGEYAVRMVEAATGSERLVHRPTSGTSMVPAFSPDSRWLAVSDRDNCLLFDTGTGAQHWASPVADVGLPVARHAFAAAGDRLLLVHCQLDPGPLNSELLRTLSVEHGAPTSTVPCEGTGPGSVSYGLDRCLQVSPDRASVARAGRWLNYGGATSGVVVWNVADGRQRFPMRPLAPLTDIYSPGASPPVQYSPDSRLLAVGCGRSGPGVQVLDAGSGDVVFEELGTDVYDLAFSADGTRLAVNYGTGLRLYTVDVQVVPVADPGTAIAVRNLGDPVRAVAVSGGIGLAGAGAGRTATLLYAESGRPLIAKELRGVLSAIRFSRDAERFAAAGSDGSVYVFGSVLGEQAWLQPHRGPVGAIEFVPGAREDLVAAIGLPDDAARLFDGGTGQVLWTSPHPGPVGPVAVDPSGRWIATGCTDGITRILARDTGQPLPFTVAGGGSVGALCANHDGSLLAIGNSDGSVVLIDPGTGQRLEPLTHPFPVAALAFNLDGSRLASGCDDQTVHLIDVTGGVPTPVTSRSFDGAVVRLCFDPGGGQLAVVTDAGTVSIVDAGDLGPILDHPHPGAVLDASYSPDGTLLVTGCDDGFVRVFRRPPR
jgi:WD40 repeat protein